MIIEIAALSALATLIAASRWPGLRYQAMMLCLAVVVAFIASPLPPNEKAFYYLAVDIGGGVIAGGLFWLWREKTCLGFIVLSMLCVVAHLALFASPNLGYIPNAKLWTGTLNVLFFAMIFMVGGTGYARRHRHIALPSWPRSFIRNSAKGAR